MIKRYYFYRFSDVLVKHPDIHNYGGICYLTSWRPRPDIVFRDLKEAAVKELGVDRKFIQCEIFKQI